MIALKLLLKMFRVNLVLKNLERAIQQQKWNDLHFDTDGSWKWQNIQLDGLDYHRSIDN